MNSYRFLKYRDINKNSIESLLTGSLYFAPPEKLNDPFDCNVDIQKAILNAANNTTGKKQEKLKELSKNKELYKHLQADIANLGICSFSLALNKMLLWCHYANNHKGMAILYDFPEEFLNDGKTFVGVSNVSYAQDSLTNWFINVTDDLPANFDEFVIELAKQLVTTKSPDWAYEDEVRIIRPETGTLKIEKDYIQQVCFGLHTPESDIELIRQIVGHYQHEVELCRVVRTEHDFGTNITKT